MPSSRRLDIEISLSVTFVILCSHHRSRSQNRFIAKLTMLSQSLKWSTNGRTWDVLFIFALEVTSKHRAEFTFIFMCPSYHIVPRCDIKCIATKSARDDGFKSTLSSLPGTVHEPYVKWILKRTKQLAYRTVISKLKLVYDLCVYSVYKGNVIANSLWDYHSNFRKWGGKCESARRRRRANVYAVSRQQKKREKTLI